MDKSCLLVTGGIFDAILYDIEKIKKVLGKSNIKFKHFDGGVPNLITINISDRNSIAKGFH